MARNYRNYTDEEIIKCVSEVKSIAGLLKKLNLVVAGGNYANMKKTLQNLNVDTSHFTGKCWNKQQQLKDWSEYTSCKAMKPHIIKLRGHRCENCKLSEWFSIEIKLELHHIDGDRTNNILENLQLLCPNCHSNTENWRKSAYNRL